MKFNLYTTIGAGLETVVSREMADLGLKPTRVEPGRVRFIGTMGDVCRAIVGLRSVSRVVRELELCEVHNEQEIYDVVRKIDWPRLFPLDATFRVTFNAHSSLVRNSLFQTYRIKDAICDTFADRYGRRPDVDTNQPEVSVFCYLENRRFSVGLDAAGDPLHMRGYRVSQHPASLREHLAAAMVLQSRWAPPKPLYDPFCGSGTLLTEAMLIGLGLPPSIFRRRFAVERWPEFEPQLFARLREESKQGRARQCAIQIGGADVDADAIGLAQRNIESAGFKGAIEVQQQSVDAMQPVYNGVVITNPPYGERMGDAHSVSLAYQAFRQRALQCHGSSIVVLCGNPEFERLFSLRPSKTNRMRNGSISCTLFQYQIREPTGTAEPERPDPVAVEPGAAQGTRF